MVCTYYFERSLLELAGFSSLFSWDIRDSQDFSGKLQGFFSPFLHVIQTSKLLISFNTEYRARLWNFLSKECCLLTYDCLTKRIN